MKNKSWITVSLLLLIVPFQSLLTKETNSWKSLNPPSMSPQLFPLHLAESQDYKHSCLVFSADGNEIYYSVYIKQEDLQRVFFVRFDGEKWSKPTRAPFCGAWNDGQPAFSNNGQRLYFSSDRPHPGKPADNPDSDIWFVEKNKNGWSVPIWGGAVLNSLEENESIEEIASDGTMYIVSYDERKVTRLYQSRFREGEYQPRTLLKILSKLEAFHEPIPLSGIDFKIISKNIKKGKYYYSYLFISVKMDNGNWSDYTDMGELFNTGEGRFPSFSPDGKHFFFTSYRSGQAEFYWLDAQVVHNLMTRLRNNSKAMN